MISLKEAREILGADVLQPRELGAALRVRHRQQKEYLQELDVVPYKPETLLVHKGVSVLFPGYPLSLRELQKHCPHEFYYSRGHVGGRYLQERFARINRPRPGWYLIPKEPLHPYTHQRSINVRWSNPHYCHIFISEMAMFLVGYKILRGTRLCSNSTVVCGDCYRPYKDRKPWNFCVGIYKESGLGIWHREPGTSCSLDRHIFNRLPDEPSFVSNFRPAY